MSLNYSKDFLLFVMKLVTLKVLNGYIIKNVSLFRLSIFIMNDDSLFSVAFTDVYNGVLIYSLFRDESSMGINWDSKLSIITMADRPYLEMVLQGVPHNCIPQIGNINGDKEKIYVIYENSDSSTVLFEFIVEVTKLGFYIHGLEEWVESLRSHCEERETIKLIVRGKEL